METKIKNWQGPTEKELLQFFLKVKNRCASCGKQMFPESWPVIKRCRYYWYYGNYCQKCRSKITNKKTNPEETNCYAKLLWKLGKRKKAWEYKRRKNLKGLSYDL